MFRSAFLALVVSFSVGAQTHVPQKNLVSRYFKKIPVTEALATFGTSSQRELDADSIKVLVWNIKKTEMKPWKAEFSEYAKGKDLFVIQEAYDVPRMMEEIGSYSGVRWDLGMSFKYVRYNLHATGTMLGSTAEPDEVIVTHTPDHEPVTNTPKALTFAKYPLDNCDESLLVISVHAINFRELGPFKRNMLQARAEIEKHQGPVLFAGDFNTHLKNRMSYLRKMASELGLSEVAFKNGHQRMRVKVLGSFLDHGFVRGLTVKHAEVLGKSRGSDHKPMVLELSHAAH